MPQAGSRCRPVTSLYAWDSDFGRGDPPTRRERSADKSLLATGVVQSGCMASHSSYYRFGKEDFHAPALELGQDRCPDGGDPSSQRHFVLFHHSSLWKGNQTRKILELDATYQVGRGHSSPGQDQGRTTGHTGMAVAPGIGMELGHHRQDDVFLIDCSQRRREQVDSSIPLAGNTYCPQYRQPSRPWCVATGCGGCRRRLSACHLFR